MHFRSQVPNSKRKGNMHWQSVQRVSEYYQSGGTNGNVHKWDLIFIFLLGKIEERKEFQIFVSNLEEHIQNGKSVQERTGEFSNPFIEITNAIEKVSYKFNWLLESGSSCRIHRGQSQHLFIQGKPLCSLGKRHVSSTEEGHPFKYSRNWNQSSPLCYSRIPGFFSLCSWKWESHSF